MRKRKFLKRLLSLSAVCLMALQYVAPVHALDQSIFDVKVEGDGIAKIKESDNEYEVDKDNPLSLKLDVGTEVHLQIDSQKDLTISSITLNDTAMYDFDGGSSYEHDFTIEKSNAELVISFDKGSVSNTTSKEKDGLDQPKIRAKRGDSGGAGGGSGSGGAATNDVGVQWTIWDHNDNGWGLAGSESNPNTGAVFSAIDSMGIVIEQQYVPRWQTDQKVRNALVDAISQCRTNYRNTYGTEQGFKPRIVAVGVGYGIGTRRYYNASTQVIESLWIDAWNNASQNRNLTLYHAGQPYKVDSRFHNGSQSLTGFALNQLAGKDNIRIIVLDETQPAPPYGKVKIKKVSSKPEFTTNNSCYGTFEGAQYGLYSDSSATKRVGLLTLKANGESNTVENIKQGKYYIKEIKAPEGYALDPTIYPIEVKAGETASKQFEDTPQSDPVGIILGKVDLETDLNKPQGSATLENAEFTVKFYKGFYDTDPAKQGVRAERIWVLRTDEDGYTKLSKNYVISGDDFYYNGNSDPTLPLGTITIQETKAPEGYYINDEVFVRQIKADGTSELVETYNQPKVPEQVINLDLRKVQDPKGNVSETIPNAVFTHTKPDGTQEDLITDQDGVIHLTGLETGKHVLKEKSVMAGYEINKNKIEFNVISGKGVEIQNLDSSMTVTSGYGDNKLDKRIDVQDKVSDYSLQITKLNDHKKLLDGAEFTLYSDPECRNAIDTQTTKNGVLKFEHLKDREIYYFKETKAPKGYRVPKTNNQEHVYKLYVEAIPVKGQFDFWVDDVKYTVNQTNTENMVYLNGSFGNHVVNVKVINPVGKKLPATGSNKTMIFTGTGLLVMITALLTMKLRKDKKYEK